MNQVLFVVDNPKKFPLHVPDFPIVSSKEYLTNSAYYGRKKIKVYNLCRSYRYQSTGYYVSLLASARGHKPLPSIEAIQDMKSLSISRVMTEDLDDLISTSLKSLHSPQFVLSVYFGRNMAKRYDRLCKQLFNLFPCPFLRAEFRKSKDEWTVHHIGPISINDVPDEHLEFVQETAKEYFSKVYHWMPKRKVPLYDMAILINREDNNPPSDEKAIKKFMKAARKQGMGVETIDKDDFGRLSEFDGLFIRETTQVNHHTYRFSRFAEAEGLVVIDDPHSIRVCTNKVFLGELLSLHQIPHPKTVIVHRDNRGIVPAEIGFPCILKKPDSSFSQGVFKAENQAELDELLNELLKDSDLIIAQEFLPTEFDWRVGILNRTPLYVCQYYMASKHWQIQKKDSDGNTRYGRVKTLAVEDAPKQVIKVALRAANLIGDGLYGVDLKEVDNKIYVIEINDNPSIDTEIEDDYLKDQLYDEIMKVFKTRIEHKKGINTSL
ncbi:MAG: RimK family protein [bacterium]|jgi:glutathione synthase/RimK-type ligase-like ATP-grasp enzyme|nr:RimK family protein [bacterium]